MHVIGEIPTHLFLMSLIDLALVMLVAVVAGVGSVAVGMASGARAPRALMVHGEGVGTIGGEDPQFPEVSAPRANLFFGRARTNLAPLYFF